MKPKISIITLGVRDLPKSIKFYKALGFELETEEGIESIAFFMLEGAAARLALYPLDKLAEDSKSPDPLGGTPPFTLAHNVGSPEEVDSVLAEVAEKGANIVKSAEEVFWGGYSGYFSDPDGYLWEVAHNPFTDLT